MIGAFVAATVVSLVQYVRTREPKLLPLMVLLALQAFALSREPGDLWRTVSLSGMCLAGLALVFLLSVRGHPPARR